MDNEIIPEGYTRVSSILAIFQAYAHIPNDKLKKAQEVGTEVHAAIKSYFEGIFEPVDLKKVPYIESFLKWVQEKEVSPIFVEKRFYDRSLMITGQLDLLTRIHNETVLVDFKTGSWSHPEIWKLQATFYSHLLKVSGQPIPERYLFVQLMKSGEAPILYSFAPDSSDWDICLSAYQCYKYFNTPTEIGD